MSLRIRLGVDDFKKLREDNLLYIDKSHIITEMFGDMTAEVYLFPRPRRFGKTLNLSMLRYFFEKTDEKRDHLFEGLSVWSAGDHVRQHFQRYPVIFLTLKEAKQDRFELCYQTIKAKIIDVYNAHRYLLEPGVLDDVDRTRFQAILDGTADQLLLENSLFNLSSCLRRVHGQPVMILIDEYDTPIHAGYMEGYAKEILGFLRGLLGACLKGNTNLFRGVLTGILRIAKESIFWDLNNPAVHTLLNYQFNTAFGFTEPEVIDLLQRAGRFQHLEAVRTWYNGYIFGGQVIYNPWSVLSYLHDFEAEPKPYWLSTSSNDLVKRLLMQRASRLQSAFQTLLEGGGIEMQLQESTALGELEQNEAALWSLLVFSGYLKAEKRPWRLPDGSAIHWLTIPNVEVRRVYSETFQTWIQLGLQQQGGELKTLLDAMLRGDPVVLEEQLQKLVLAMISYHDRGKGPPEKFYQGFVLGLLASLEPYHQVRSNREAGKGRPDVMIRPLVPERPAVVLELKVPDKNKTLDDALDVGEAQIHAKDYMTELRSSGASEVHAFAIAFDGKTVRVRGVAPNLEQTA